MLSDRQKATIRLSFQAIKPISDRAGALFYNRLFEVEPSVKMLFRNSPAEQGRVLMQLIAMAVASLDRLETVVPALEGLGERHVGYGVKDEHYDTVGVCLLWTLEQSLGDAFTDEVRDAWAVLYGIVAGTMQRGAARATSASLALAG